MLCSLSTELRVYRVFMHRTVTDFARELCISQATMSSIELDTRPIPENAITAFARKIAFVNPSYLFTRYRFDSSFASLLDPDIAFSFFATAAVVRELTYMYALLPFLSHVPSLKELMSLCQKDENLLVYYNHLLTIPKNALLSYLSREASEVEQKVFAFLVTLIISPPGTFSIFNARTEQFLPPRSYTSLREMLYDLVYIADLTDEPWFPFDRAAVKQKALELQTDDAVSFIHINSQRMRSDLVRLCFSRISFLEKNEIIVDQKVELEGLSGYTYIFPTYF